MPIKSPTIYTDGASLGNPGPSAIGAVIKDERGRRIAEISQSIGQATNNQAEYRAIIAALEKAIELGVNRSDIYSDSELLVEQINERYRVKNAALKPLYQKVKQLQSQLEGSTITWVPGRENTEAHNLASKALS